MAQIGSVYINLWGIKKSLETYSRKRMMKQSCYLYLQKIIKCIRNGFDDFFANIGNIYMYSCFCSVVVVVCLFNTCICSCLGSFNSR